MLDELLTDCQNFNFQPFDLSQRGPSVTRSPLLAIKVWTQRERVWGLHLEELVDLRALNFIGTLQNHAFPPNGLIFHLVDGVYSFDLPSRHPRPKQAPSLPTSSYNALMKLATLDYSIQDALATRARITTQINEILEQTPLDESPQARDHVDLADKYVTQQRRALRAAEKRREELKESLAARREAIQTGRELQEKAAHDVENATDKLEASKKLLSETKEKIHGQRRRICSDLADIFPLTPTTAGTLSFQICGLALANTDDSVTLSSRADEDTLSAALGFVALLTNHLQFYLSVPLPYPLTPFGSRSLATDNISNLADSPRVQQRDFPLYLPRGGSTAADFRFKYAWFLLNKDIEALCSSQGLKVVDIRHTLPNLKYLLYVCSAGRDEVPERKRGGVRGLWAGRLKNRISTAGEGIGSRRGSAESELLVRQRDELRRALSDDAQGLAIPDGSPFSAVGLPFDEETRLTLRTKGLRENVGR